MCLVHLTCHVWVLIASIMCMQGDINWMGKESWHAIVEHFNQSEIMYSTRMGVSLTHALHTYRQQFILFLLVWEYLLGGGGAFNISTQQ